MYFEVENTPEHIRRARNVEASIEPNIKEERPRLIIAPFSKPPLVAFENVLLGTTSERVLEVFNPTKQVQKITLGNELPEGFILHWPGEWLTLQAETCYCITMAWTPTQPIGSRYTIRFITDNRRRYDVLLVLKSTMCVKGKLKKSPGKIKKKVTKHSPISFTRKKAEIIYKTTDIKKTYNVVQQKIYKTSNKENVLSDFSIDSKREKCPFGSPNSIDFTFDTSEIFSKFRKENEKEVLQQTYNKYNRSPNLTKHEIPLHNNVLRPSNKNYDNTSDIFDNLSFTPLKSVPVKCDKLDKGPRIILSVNSESEFDDSLNMDYANKENATHSIVCITSSTQGPSKWPLENLPNYAVPSKKVPNTSSPKEFNSPNFSINTELSRISDLSFFPQRFSTERKILKTNNETHDLLDDLTHKVSSDTYTKESPNNPYPSLDYNVNQGFGAPPRQPKVCRQSLFKESLQQRDYCEKNYLCVNNFESQIWQNQLRSDINSSPRSITPPLQSIPEESCQLSDTQVLDKTEIKTSFTINCTFDKINDRNSLYNRNKRQSWSKKAARVEPELWKIPVSGPKKSNKTKTVNKVSYVSNTTFEKNKSIDQNISINRFSNVYSQSLTVDPFLSSTYFFDEEAVDKFETEFKRWLNYILTPPADLDSNIEQKIDVGKAWIENRNKEIPLAPTKEQVCSTYHNSHRLASLRRSARTLVLSPEFTQVIIKLNAQIDKKLIQIRADRNLHLDIGLQKIIMELLLSFNPLWLRVGLEAIYGFMIPLKSNNDIEGLTTFIIQRMFKNPHLKNKHSKSSAPNMLLPAYMEAIKKFTLKKFFMLIFFLDQAKQRKLIQHDPCLFCRNAVCKESREVIIRFTRELIAGIGDITKHLRPLGYVVSHKQSYLDEYKYAVHNIAVDIRDGVRLTKVMEVILMKNGLLKQLRTPAISRLQKIHNVQVALNALKEANFTIVGNISANDIADGHREKTLSLLWQLIHEFRAPLFEKAANVIQMWWRKKYEVIVAKRKEEEMILEKRNNAASIIQYWWRRIQYTRLVEYKMQQITAATIIVQKFCRMWLCKSRLKKMKRCVIRIEQWYNSMKLLKAAKETLQQLKIEKEEHRRLSAIKIQACFRRWICVRRYKTIIRKVTLIQSIVRCYLIRRWYISFRKSVIFVQEKYRGKLMMRQEMHILSQKRKSAVLIQSLYRMFVQRNSYLKLKKSVKVIEDHYIALMHMRICRSKWLKLKQSTLLIQTLFRGKKAYMNYQKYRDCIIKIQRRFRANTLMKKERTAFLRIQQATIILQIRFRANIKMKQQRENYLAMKHASILIQRRFLCNVQRKSFIRTRNAVIALQKWYRSLKKMKRERYDYLQKIKSVNILQSRIRAYLTMKRQRCEYVAKRNAAILIQKYFRSHLLSKTQRNNYLILKKATINIQSWYRSIKTMQIERKNYLKTKNATIILQIKLKAYLEMKRRRNYYLSMRNAAVSIQNYYRSYLLSKEQRRKFIVMKNAAKTVQVWYRSLLIMRIDKANYLQIKKSVEYLQAQFRAYLQMKKLRNEFIAMRNAVIVVQKQYRRKLLLNSQRNNFVQLRKSAITLQRQYRSLVSMKRERANYLELKKAATNIQRRYRALRQMKICRKHFNHIRKACIIIQQRYRAQIMMKQEKFQYLTLKFSCKVIQKRYRAYSLGRKVREGFLKKKAAASYIQQWYRRCRVVECVKAQYVHTRQACVTIQRTFRAYIIGKKQRIEYLRIKSATVCIQKYYKYYIEMKTVRQQYIQLKMATVQIQRYYRAKVQRNQYIKVRNAALKIQRSFRSYRESKKIRQKYCELKAAIILIQTHYRRYLDRKHYLRIREAVILIQKWYRERKAIMLTKMLRDKACICIQKNIRRFLVQHQYREYRQKIIFIQRLWKNKLITRVLRCEFLQTRRIVTNLQAIIRGYLVRKQFREKRERLKVEKEEQALNNAASKLQTRRIVTNLQAIIRGYLVRKQFREKRERLKVEKEEQALNNAASKLQAAYRAHLVRKATFDPRVAELRKRWREGGLQSMQSTLKERNDKAMQVLNFSADIEAVILAFKSLELLTEVFPMMYKDNASLIVSRVYVYMSVTNRSISSIEVLMSAASLLVNLTRYHITGPKIYARERIAPILKYMWRFSNSETQLFCILCTYIWLFSKYDHIREDLTEYLHMPENHKMLVTIKSNIERMKRMADKCRKHQLSTPRSSKFAMNYAHPSQSMILPSTEPDYGIRRIDKPQYFEDALQGINSLFKTFNL